MEELIAIAVQFTVEVIGSILTGVPFGFNTRKPAQPESESMFLRIMLTFMGGVLGWASAYLVPFRLLPYSWLRLLNLLIAPIIGGYTAKVIAGYRAKENVLIDPKVHFWNAFWFTLAFALLRLAYASRYAI